MTETARRRRKLGAGHHKFICVVHIICCIGFFVVGCFSVFYTTFDSNLAFRLLGTPPLWAFLLCLKSFALALTDYIIARKGERCIRDDNGHVVCLVKFQATISVVSLPIYPWGMFVSVFHAVLYSRDLVVPAVLYYVSFVASVFATFNCCYASCSCCGNSRNDVDPGHERVVAFRVTERGLESSITQNTQNPMVESPPNLEPCASADRSTDEYSKDQPPAYTVMQL